MDEQATLQQTETSPDYPPVEAHLFADWLYEHIRSYLSGRVLEIGSSPNSISRLFIEKGRRIHLSTPDKDIREQLHNTYRGIEIIRHVHSINIHRENFVDAYPEDLARIFDSIIILNGMNNGVYDQKVVQNAIHLLNERGRLILLAPAFTTLFSGLERDLAQLERFNRRSLRRLLTNQMEVLMTIYFNLLANPTYDRSGLSVLVIARRVSSPP